MTKMLAHTIVLLFVLAGCGSADGESFDPPQEGMEDSTEAADQEDGDAPETGSADTADEEQPSDNDRTEPPDVVFHAHVPRLPE